MMTRATRKEAGPDEEPAADIHVAGSGSVRLGVLENYLGFHLRLAQDASFRAFRRRTGHAELRPGWFAILSVIGDNPGITPMALSRATGRDKSTLTPVLRELLKRQLLEREPRPGDRRSYGLQLTRQGRTTLSELAAHAAEHDRVLDGIAGERKGELVRVLRKIAEELG